MSADTFSFQCKCGARLQARPEMAGKKGKCKHCGETFVIPAPSAVAAKPSGPAKTTHAKPGSMPSPAPQEKKETKEQVCSICQTRIQPFENALPCNSCGLPFHVDCWQANFGCATYGCPNVNVLKPGPDIAIGHAALAQAQVQTPSPAWQQPQAPARAPAGDIPWEYILLAISAVAGMASCVTCGLSSLIVALAACLYAAHNPKANMYALTGVWFVAAISFLFGMMVSCILYFPSLL